MALWFTFREILTAEWQAKKLAKLGTELTFRLEPGKAKPLPAPAGGPYDERLGYDQMAAFSSGPTATPSCSKRPSIHSAAQVR